jgi:uncharacterized protein YndB with AHSA1/START domain
MRIELRRTYPVPRKLGFDYITDPRHWPDWVGLELLDDEKAAWAKKGDGVPYRYRWMGVPMEGLGTLMKRVPGEYLLAEFKTGLLPLATFENKFENAGAHAFTYTYCVEYKLPEGLLGKVMDYGLMIGPYLKREMRLHMERLGEIFMAMHEGKLEKIA